MERADLEKLTPAQRAALPKGDRMFLAPMDESTGKGEEIIAMCKKFHFSASIAADLIDLHGFDGATALIERTQARASHLARTGDIGQAEPVIADADASVRGRAPGMTDLMVTPEAIDEALAEIVPATLPIPDERCTSMHRVGYTLESDEQIEWLDVSCYLNEGHGGAKHHGWHPKMGELSWDVVEDVEGA